MHSLDPHVKSRPIGWWWRLLPEGAVRTWVDIRN